MSSSKGQRSGLVLGLGLRDKFIGQIKSLQKRRVEKYAKTEEMSTLTIWRLGLLL